MYLSNNPTINLKNNYALSQGHLHQPGLRVLLPGDVRRGREVGGQGREVPAEDQAQVPSGAQVRGREEAHDIPPGEKSFYIESQ